MRRSAFVTASSCGVSLLAISIACCASAQSLSERLQGVAEQKRSAAAHNTSKAAMLGALMYTDITCDFKATRAREAIDYVGNALGVSLVGRYSSDKAGNGIDPEAEITLKAERKPALVVLEMILDQCGTDEPCTWQIRDSFIEVGTKERLSVPSAQELRMYPVRDLLIEVPRYDNAPVFNLNQSIQQGNQGGGQGGGGNGGGGGGFGGGGGGGGFGGGGSGGGSGGGGGNVFGDPKEDPARKAEEDKANELVTIIMESVEPDAWTENGGQWASIRYYQGVLIVRAPDWIHRKLGGYPFSGQPAHQVAESRYVTFTPGVSIVENVKFRDGKVTGATGGGTTGGGGGGGAPINSPSAPSTPPSGGSSK